MFFSFNLGLLFWVHIGVALGLITSIHGLQDGFQVFSISTNYTSLGLILRIIVGVIGLVSLVLTCVALFRKGPKRRILVAAFLSLACLGWEFSILIFISALIFGFLLTLLVHS